MSASFSRWGGQKLRATVWTGRNGPVQGDSGFTGFMCQELHCGLEVAPETETPKTDLQRLRKLFWHFKWNTSVSHPQRPRRAAGPRHQHQLILTAGPEGRSSSLRPAAGELKVQRQGRQASRALCWVNICLCHILFKTSFALSHLEAAPVRSPEIGNILS